MLRGRVVHSRPDCTLDPSVRHTVQRQRPMHKRMLQDALGRLGVGLRTSNLLCGSCVRDRRHGVQHYIRE
jgi:hypothetical protein